MVPQSVECDLTYPGIKEWQGIQITRSLGVVPDLIRIRYVAQNTPPASFGPLLFTYSGPGVGNRSLHLGECQLDRVTVITTGDGYVHEATLLDARWKWAYGAISGEYNVPDPRGEILAGTERTPQELATLLLHAMFNLPEEFDDRRKGSKRRARQTKASALPFDVSALPNDSRPRAEWDDENPARALDRLCDSLGCVIVYKWTGHVVIARAGVGNLLVDDDDVTDLNLTLDPKELPDTIMVCTPPQRFEVVVALLPRGLDTDGKYKHPFDLSYVPTANHAFGAHKTGWVDGVDVLTNEVHLALAKESLFRTFQIAVGHDRVNNMGGYVDLESFTPATLDPLLDRFSGFRLDLPGFGLVGDLWQVLPVESALVSFSFNASREDYTGQAPRIFGLFQQINSVGKPSKESNNFDPTLLNLSEDDHRLPLGSGYSLDRDKGLVTLHAPLVRWGTKQTNYTPQLFPILWMRLTVSVRDKKSRAWLKYRREKVLGQGRGTGPRVVHRDDLQHNTIVTYEFDENWWPTPKKKGGKIGDPDFDTIVGVETNEDKVRSLCDKQIAATIAAYAGTVPHVVSYRGLKLIETDGAIRQVMVQAGDDGFCETLASRNDEALGTDLRLSEKQQIGFVLDQFNRGISTAWAQERIDRKKRQKR